MTIIHCGVESASARREELYLSPLNFASSGPVYSYGFAQAGFRFSNNTYVYSINNVNNNIQLGGDQWVTPRDGLDPANYQIRWFEVSVSGNVSQTFLNQTNTTGWTEETWLDLSTDKLVQYNYSFGSFQNQFNTPYYIIGDEYLEITLNVEIRYGDGSSTSLNPNTSLRGGDNYASLGVFTIFLGFPV